MRSLAKIFYCVRGHATISVAFHTTPLKVPLQIEVVEDVRILLSRPLLGPIGNMRRFSSSET